MAQTYETLFQQMLLEFNNRHLETAEKLAQSILHIRNEDVVALQILGLTCAMQNRASEAIVPLKKASNLEPNNAEILINLVKAQQSIGQYSEAIKTYENLNSLLPNNHQILTDMGTAFGKLHEYEKANICYARAIELEPNYFLAWSNLGNLQLEQNFLAQSITSYEVALSKNPNYPETWTNFGNALYALARYDEALLAHNQALSLDPSYGEAWRNHGNTLIELKRNDEALISYQKAYEIMPNQPFLIGHLLHGYASNCDWESFAQLAPSAMDLVARNKPAVYPFIMLHSTNSRELQKIATKTFNLNHFPKEVPHFLKTADKKNSKVRIGYFSSDFKEHPVGILMENILTHHDRSKFELIGFFLNKPTNDKVENRLKNLFDEVHDLSLMSDYEAYQHTLARNIDIAIDLNGHTAGAKTHLFVKRVAPIQVNYLGYAGTMNLSNYQYLIADSIAVPPEHQISYSEKIAYLPHSFFPADTLLPQDSFGELPTRIGQGLPENGIIFACFNNSYKITQKIYSLWMELLRKTPNSVLWLTKPNKSAIKNLQIFAKNHGVDPARLIFAERVPSRRDHLSRLRLADLFLDTDLFNAHTTAADALWAVVPVLTILGQTFASRVAASQLTALGMPELICTSEDEYLKKAFELAAKPHLLTETKNKLRENIKDSDLFNTVQYVKDLENLYSKMIAN